MNVDRTAPRLRAGLGVAALTATATLGLGIATAAPASACDTSSCGTGGGKVVFTGDDNGKHLGQIKQGNTPGDSGNHTGDPN